MTDPIADMISRIRNAVTAKHTRVDLPASKLKAEIARILQDEGYIQGFKLLDVPAEKDGQQADIPGRLTFEVNRRRVDDGDQPVREGDLGGYDTVVGEAVLRRSRRHRGRQRNRPGGPRPHLRVDDRLAPGVLGIEEKAVGHGFLGGAADADKREAMIKAVEDQLETPYGVMMLAPAYTAMRDDVGRVTQKFPGSAENGSVYNHAAVFYIYSLYTIQDSDRAYRLLRQMLSGPDEADYRQRGQMPVYIPNYYRGAYYQHPRTAGRSSQLFNTGTVSWVYRSLIEGLFGLKGCCTGLLVEPQLPKHWKNARAVRQFREATFEVVYSRKAGLTAPSIHVDGTEIQSNRIENIEAGRTYKVDVILPE